ncbi:DUF1145 domain-containing protein, partial [Endozoicomonas sp.]|nr:DUF1145 domain-containing protein [Endozoicomonas sp.]
DAMSSLKKTQKLFIALLLSAAKAVTLLFWLAALFNHVLPMSESLRQGLQWLALSVFIVHCCELIFCHYRCRSAGCRLAMADSVRILIGGAFHLVGVLSNIDHHRISGQRSA